MHRPTDALTRYHRRTGTRWRAYDVWLQAVLTCAWLEGGHTYRSLAAGNGIPRSTCRRYVQEGIKVLARRALPLTEVVRLAVKAGWPYLIVDGVNVPTERIAAEYTRKQYWELNLDDPRCRDCRDYLHSPADDRASGYCQ